MRTARQFSVTLVNKPGRLASALSALHSEKVNLLALTVSQAGGRGTLRFVPDEPEPAARALGSIGIDYEEADVLLVEMPNQSGAFAKVCERLAQEHLNIDYAYTSCSAATKTRGALAVVKVNDLAKASRVLTGDAAGQRNGRQPVRRPAKARRAESKWTARTSG